MKITGTLDQLIAAGTHAPPVLYKSITELPLSIFIECLIDKNLTLLIKSGEASSEDLLATWTEIQQEYSDALGDYEVKFYWTLYKEITLLSLQYDEIHIFIDFLSKFYVQSIAQALNKLLRTTFKFEPEDRQLELGRCRTISQAIKLRLDIKVSTFNALQSKHEGKKEVTREYFQSILNTLSDHSKYEINESITVFRFCDKINRFNRYVENQKK